MWRTWSFRVFHIYVHIIIDNCIARVIIHYIYCEGNNTLHYVTLFMCTLAHLLGRHPAHLQGPEVHDRQCGRRGVLGDGQDSVLRGHTGRHDLRLPQEKPACDAESRLVTKGVVCVAGSRHETQGMGT